MFEVLTPVLCVILGIVVVALSLLGSAVRIVQEYERGVIFRLGRLVGAKGPGLFFIVPIIDRMMKIDLRTVTLDVPTQEAITYDNVTVKVNAVAYFRVIEPERAVVQVEDYRRATYQIAQTSLRSVIGEAELDELLAHRDRINNKLAKIIDEATEPWASRSAWSRSRTSSCRRRCSVRWLARPRLSARSAPRSSMPRASSKPRSSSARPRTRWPASRRRSSSATCRR